MNHRARHTTGGLAFAALLLAAFADEAPNIVKPDDKPTDSAANLSPWSPATPLAELNATPGTDGCPFLTQDGNALFFASNRSGGFGDLDLYVARWDSSAQRWGDAVNLGSKINTPSNESCAVLLNNGREMLFHSNRPRGAGGPDLWMVTRRDEGDALVWELPINLATLNTSAAEFGHGAYQEADGSTVVFFNSNRPGGTGLQDIYMSRRPAGGAFPAPTLVAELSTPELDQFARLSSDGREIVFASNRPGTLGGLDLWSATRLRTTDPWRTPVNLGPNLNSTVDDAAPAISWDRRTLVFLSARSGNLGLFQSNRTRMSGAK